MKKILILTIPILSIFLSLSTSHAQSQPETPRLFAILESRVQPGWVPVYESAFSDLYELHQENQTPFPFGPILSLSESCSYFHIFPPLNELNDLLRLQTLFNPTGSPEEDKLLSKIPIALESKNWRVVRERPDLSYHPNNHRLAFGGESQYFNLTFFYPFCQSVKEIETVCLEWIELYKTYEIPYGYSVFETVLGDDSPSLIFVYSEKSASEFFQHQQEIAQKLVYKESGMMEKALKLCRKYTVHTGYYRPELTGWQSWGE